MSDSARSSRRLSGTRYKAAFREAWDEEAEHAAHTDEIGSWKDQGMFDSGKTRWEDTLTFEEPAEGLGGINLSAVNGKVEIDGTDGEVIRIVARRVVRSTDEAKGAAYREQFRPVVTRQNGTLVVHTHHHKKGEQTPKHIKEAKMDYAVSLPAGFLVAVKTVNGSVELTDVHEFMETGATLGATR